MRTLFLLLLSPLFMSTPAQAGLFNRNKGEEPPPPGDFPPYAEVIDGLEVIEGLFDFYRDPESAQVFLSVGEDQWDSEYLMSMKMDGSVGERGLYGTIMMDAFVFQLHRQGNQVQVIQRNLTFRADEGTPEALAIPRSFSDAVITAAPVASMPQEETGEVLVDLGALFAQTDLVGFGKVLSQGLGHEIAVVAPYRGRKKPDLIRENQHLPLELTLTCMTPVNDLHCGVCQKCEERQDAFVDAGVEDPTEYATVKT